MGKKKRRMFSPKFEYLRELWTKTEEDAAEEIVPAMTGEKVVIEKEKPKIVEVEKPKTTLKKKASPKTKAKSKTKKTTAKKSTRKKK